MKIHLLKLTTFCQFQAWAWSSMVSVGELAPISHVLMLSGLMWAHQCSGSSPLNQPIPGKKLIKYHAWHLGLWLSYKRRGEGCQSCVGWEPAILMFCLHACPHGVPYMGQKTTWQKHVARPLSPSIAQKSEICPKMEPRWCDLSVRHGFWLKMEMRWCDLPAKLFTCRFSFKKEMLWCDLPAKFYECGASSKKEGGGKNYYFNRNSCYISIEQWEIHAKSWIK